MANVTRASGVHFTVHDLRRTFITIAESLDISAYALKRLMNHKMNNDGAIEKTTQLITDYFLKCMGIVKSADIIEIQPLQFGSQGESQLDIIYKLASFLFKLTHKVGQSKFHFGTHCEALEFGTH